MSIEQIVVHARTWDRPGPAVQSAFALASRMKARIEGLYVASLPPAAFVSPEAVALHLPEAERELDQVREPPGWWLAALGQRGLSGAWHAAQGDPSEAICQLASWSDLTVVERPTIQQEAPAGFGLPTRVVFGSRAPVLVVPEQCQIGELGQRVLVAFNGSRSSIRALARAMPLLRQAEHIVLLDGRDTKQGDLPRLPQIELEAFLRQRRLAVEHVQVVAGSSSGEAIHDACREHACDLIVMGAWGQSRLKEWILGGATKYLFQFSDRPLWVMH